MTQAEGRRVGGGRGKGLRMSHAISAWAEWRKVQVAGGTSEHYTRTLKYLCLYLRDPEIVDIAPEGIAGFMNGLADLGWERSGLLNKSYAIRGFLDYWRRRGFAVPDPKLVPVPKFQRKMPNVCGAERLERLLAAMPEREPKDFRDEAVVRLIADTGMRVGEACSLDLADLDFSSMSGTVRTEKSRGRRPFRQFAWSSGTDRSLRAWLRRRPEGGNPKALFVALAHGPRNSYGGRMGPGAVADMLRARSQDAGVPTVNAHSLRHRKGRDIIARGGSAADVMNVLGHSDVTGSTPYMTMAGEQFLNRARGFLDCAETEDGVRMGRYGEQGRQPDEHEEDAEGAAAEGRGAHFPRDRARHGRGREVRVQVVQLPARRLTEKPPEWGSRVGI